jgi:hypothetical protein
MGLLSLSSEQRFAVVMIVLSILIFIAVRRAERQSLIE